MESIYKTGNETVDQLSQMRITGNVIPSAWYQTIRKESGKPYLNAIVILSDIVYWYRAAEVRSEESGELLGYKKKFKADLLQRNYQQIADQFGISKRDASNAIVELEKLGVVKRVFRKLNLGGIMIPNVLFLALDVEVLKRLTFPDNGEPDGDKRMADGRKEYEMEHAEKEAKETRAMEMSGDYRETEIKKADRQEREGSDGRDERMDKMIIRGEGKEKCEGDVSLKMGDTTEISDTRFPNTGNGVTDFGETNTEITYKDYNTESLILSSQMDQCALLCSTCQAMGEHPENTSHLPSCYQETKEEFKRQIEYDVLKHDLGDTEELDELVEIASEVLTSRADTIRVNREERQTVEVKERYKSLTMLHVQYVLHCLSETAAKIRNVRAVMITALYNASSTMSTYYGNLYRSYAFGAA